MLAAISDLHFTDGTTGSFNLHPDAWDVFFESVRRNRAHSGDEHGLTLVLAGDIFDLLRSTVWLEGRARPWAPQGLEQTALRVLRGILEANAESLRRLRDYLRDDGAGLVHIAGNHDRLISAFPALREEIVRVLGPVDFRDGEYRNPLHRVKVSHGHRSDPYNFEKGGRAPIGDAIVVDLFIRWPQEIAAAFPGDRAMYEAVREIENVHPLTDVPAWIHWSTSERSPATIRNLRAVWNDLVVRFLRSEFVEGWMASHRSRPRLFDHAQGLNVMMRGSRVFGFEAMDWLGRRLRVRDREPEHGPRVFGRDSLYLVSGHTHLPLTEAVDARRVYFNTGTWRKVWVRAREGSFTAWKVMSYVTIYGPGARHRFAACRSELQ